MAAKAPQDPRRAGPKPSLPPQQQQGPGSEAEMSPAPDFGERSYKGHDRLTGRVAVVTGGDSGIGRAVCLAFAREGADVVIAYYNEHEDAHKTATLVRDAGRRAILVAGDLAQESIRQVIIGKAVETFGRIDILVNNAARQSQEVDGIAQLDNARVEHTFQVNVISMFSLVRHALPHMAAGGSIINVASIQAYKPNPGILDYAATKGAIVSFTKGLAQELGAKGIRVNAVAPGPVWTPLIVQSFPAEKVEKFGANTPFGRAAQPAELAPAFVFLACEESRFVNAEIMGVTGGGITG